MLFQSISYTALPSALEQFGWPRLDSPGLADMFDKLVSRGNRLDALAGRGDHHLRYKTTALYYVSAFTTDPPSLDAFGKPIEQTKIGSLHFREDGARDLSLVVALGKIALLWWAATGDDFDVTAAGLGSTPVDANKLPTEVQHRLIILAQEMKAAMAENVIYTKYAGKWMGNYDVKYIRDLTDISDKLILELNDLQGYWEDIELAYARFMKATGERPGTVREVPNFAT